MSLISGYANEKLTALCVSINGIGHINTVLGIAFALKRSNHRVVFATESRWKGKYEKLGFEEEVYDEKEKNVTAVDESGTRFLKDADKTFSKPTIEKVCWTYDALEKIFQDVKFADKQIAEIIPKVKPDVVIIDHAFTFPCLIKANLPLINVCSANPLYEIDDERLPPLCSGLPLNDQREWSSFRESLNKKRSELWHQVNEWFEEKGVPPLEKYRLRHLSANLNVCVYPKPLMDDYLRLCPLGDEWHVLNHSLRKSSENFQLPAGFKRENEKLIYLSLGSIGSNIPSLMSRLVKLLANCKHKIIVVKGKFHDQLELAENMWGEPFLPQLEIIPLVNLVITHGGNNTFIETLYFGKPMIVMPLFSDQPDNAQRAVESKVGVFFDPFTVEEKQLLKAIDELLNNSEMAQRLEKISKEIRESQSMDVLVKKIEKIATNPKIPSIM